jgi:hypothetical protein
VCEITIIEFAKQIKRKEQLESGKSGDKNHNESESVGRNRISEQPLEDSSPR